MNTCLCKRSGAKLLRQGVIQPVTSFDIKRKEKSKTKDTFLIGVENKQSKLENPEILSS